MLEFITLLVGLVTGPRQVELSVVSPVVAVELRLDGELRHRLEEPPWRVEVDFGQRLRPQRLTAVGYDADGGQVDTADLVVNYSRSSFEAAIVLDAKIDGVYRSGRVVWEGALRAPPRGIDLLFDSQRLPVGDQGEFALPEHDPLVLHVLETVVVFADGSTGMASRTFGGEFSDSTTTALTAVPLRSPVGQPWRTDQIRGWIRHEGQPLEVFTAAAPRGVLVLLRDDRLEKDPNTAMPWRNDLLRTRYTSAADLSYDFMAIGPRPLEQSPGTFRLTRPTGVDRSYGLTRTMVFKGPLVPNKTIDGRRLVKKGQKLFDALAVAGLNAARRNTPRMVVLMIGRTLDDQSGLTPLQAVDYLAGIHVPLKVWAPNEKSLATSGLPAGIETYFGRLGLTELEMAIGRELRSQTIVWIEGDRLPNELSLGPDTPAEVVFAH